MCVCVCARTCMHRYMLCSKLCCFCVQGVQSRSDSTLIQYPVKIIQRTEGLQHKNFKKTAFLQWNRCNPTYSESMRGT